MTFFPERPFLGGVSHTKRYNVKRGPCVSHAKSSSRCGFGDAILHQTHTMVACTQPSTTLLPPMTAADRLAADAAAHLLPLRPLAAPTPQPSTDAATTTFTADSNGGAAAATIHSCASSPIFSMVGSPLWQVESDRLDRGST